MPYWGSISEPEIVATEAVIIEDEIQCPVDQLKTYYYNHEKKRYSLIRTVFKIIILTNRNLLNALAGSMVILPVSVLTSGASNTVPFFVAQITSSVFFFAFFLWFVLIANRIKEKSETYNDPQCNAKLRPAAKRNIEFSMCIKEEENLKVSFSFALLFLVFSIISLCLPLFIRVDFVPFI